MLVHHHSLRKRKGSKKALEWGVGGGGQKRAGKKKKKLGDEKGLGREKEGVRITGGEKGQGREERRRGRARQKSTLFGLDFVLIAISYITALKEALHARWSLLIAQC